MNIANAIDWLATPTGARVASSTGVVAFVWVTRVFFQRRIDADQEVDATLRMRWKAQLRWIAFGVAGLGLVFVWGDAVREFLLSLVVLASAVVVATKELIMCLTGSLVRATSRGFSIGDRVEMGPYRGDVVDVRLLTTVLLESGPSHERTGRRVVVPNSLYLTQAVANETFTQTYVLHSFEVPLAADEAWQPKEERLLSIATDVAMDYIAPAAAHMEALSARHALPPFDVAPRVSLVMRTAVPTLRVRVPTPARQRGRVEQDILERFLSASGDA